MKKKQKPHGKTVLRKKLWNDGIHKYIVNAEFLQCVVDINIPTKRIFRNEYKI